MTLVFDPDKHEYSKNGKKVPGVTSVLSILSDLGGIPKHILEAKAALGHEVHAAAELINQDMGIDYGSLSERAVPYVEQYEKFLAISGFQPALCEQRVYSEKYGYAGTLDLWGYLNGKAVLVDLKNTVAIAKTCGPQTEAYARALEETTGLQTEERYVLQLKPDTYRLEPMTTGDDMRTFLAALHLYHFNQRK